MKRILTIFFLLISSISFAQQKYVVKVQGQPGIYGLANNQTGDSLIFYVQGVRHAIKVVSNVDLSNYYTKSEVDNGLNGKLPIADTANMLLPYALKTKLKADSTTLAEAITTAAGGGVTGFNGRSGAVVPQSGDYSSFYYPLSTNPTGYLVASDISGKLNISDTASMLSKYARSNSIPVNNNQLINGNNYITSSAIAGKMNYADTANALLPYVRKTDATATYQPKGNYITSVPDATTTAKGIVQLAGDLAGTAAAPTVPGLATKEYLQPLNTMRQNLGDPTVREIAMFPSQFNNKFAFKNPDLIEDFDGTTWSTSTDKIPTSDPIRDMMIGGGVFGGMNIQRGTVATRLTFKSSLYVSLNYFYTEWVTGINACKITIEFFSDSAAGWTTVAETDYGSGWPNHISVPHTPIYYLYGSEVRVTFTPNWSTDTTSPYYSMPITISTMEWWGGYGDGSRTLYAVNRDKEATFPSTLIASGFKIPSGSASQFLKADGSVDANSYLTTTVADATKQPLEDQRLSTTNNVQFNNAYASNALGVSNGSIGTYLYLNPNHIGSSGIMYLPRYSTDTLATKSELLAKLDTSYRDTINVKYPIQFASNWLQLSQSWIDSMANLAGTGSGTVTQFNFTNSTGITGTVSNATTTPALSLALTSAAVGLSNVNNTSDASKPVSTATQTALNLKSNAKSGIDSLATRNYANDSLAVVVGGLKQWDFYRTGNAVKVVAVLPATQNFYMTLNTADSLTSVFRMQNTIGSFTATVSWGDGASNTYTSTDTTVSHTYATVADFRVEISFTGSHNLTNFFMGIGNGNGIQMDGFHNLTSLTELDAFELYGTKLTSIDSLAYPASLRYMQYWNTKVLTSFTPATLSPITKVIDFNHSRALTTVTLPSTYPSSILTVDFSYCNLSVTAVNNLLVYLDSKITTGTGITINLEGQSTAATPTGAGLTAKNSLISKGCSVTTD